MNDFMTKLESLNNAIGNRRNLPYHAVVQAIEKIAQSNNEKLLEFYQNNVEMAHFVSILDEKQSTSKEEFVKNIEDFFQKYPNYRDPNYQKQVFNKIRSCLPDGSPVKVKGGFAILKTERRHGRSPGGTFPVESEAIKEVEDFAHTKGSVTESEFLHMFDLMVEYMQGKELYETNRFVGQGDLALPVKVISEKPSQVAFAMNMFRETSGSLNSVLEPWTILSCPSFTHPREEQFIDGVFKFTDYKRRIILIGGSGYNGEIKKGMFAVANHIYPLKGHLSLHCSSVYNDSYKETTLIFGLSGTGKSTVSSGVSGVHVLSDDETALNLESGKTFNLENGNYYKTGGLLSEKKVLHTLEHMPPDHCAIYENVVVGPAGHVVFAADPTGNGRVSVPISCLEGAIAGGMYPLPKKIIILSRDVNGILDPVNLLNKEQIVYYLKLGYTSKTPGTEAGVNKPIPTYSKWEGGPFYDLKDEFIMQNLLKFFHTQTVSGILLNTGEGGGPFGSSHNKRYPVDFTLQLVRSYVKGDMMKHHFEHPDQFEKNTFLNTERPLNLPDVESEVNDNLNAERKWEKNGYSEFKKYATELFSEFKKHTKGSIVNPSDELKGILDAGPV